MIVQDHLLTGGAKSAQLTNRMPLGQFEFDTFYACKSQPSDQVFRGIFQS